MNYHLRTKSSSTPSVTLHDGTIEDADTSSRNVRSHLLNDAEYFNSFASRYLILHDTKFAEYNGRV